MLDKIFSYFKNFYFAVTNNNNMVDTIVIKAQVQDSWHMVSDNE